MSVLPFDANWARYNELITQAMPRIATASGRRQQPNHGVDRR
ncbi:MAG TPA: hypothetical protein VF494_03460 [Candidatus Limnocylindrales bacterium]